MERDIRDTHLFRDASRLYETFYRPGTGQVCDAAEVNVAPDGVEAAFSATLVVDLVGASPTRICSVDLICGDIRLLTFGPNSDRSPKYSPDGSQIAFLSDRHREGDFQLHLFDRYRFTTRTAPRVDGWVEYLSWSPDGTRVLLGVAGHGADVSGPQGAVTSARLGGKASWIPSVEAGNEECRWRRVWVFDLTSGSVRQVSGGDVNVWEAAWCGCRDIVIVGSRAPEESEWYSARLYLLCEVTGAVREIYNPRDQLGWPAVSPSAKHVAIVEATCSDRRLVAGDLRIVEMRSGRVQCIATAGVDITYAEWRSNRALLLAGHRGFESVVGIYDAESCVFTELWNSHEVGTGGHCISVSGIGTAGDCALVGENFQRAPEVAVVRDGKYHVVRSFDLGYGVHSRAIAAIDRITWAAPDGLQVQGWLVRPAASGPRPLIMNVHGGPVWHWHPMWLGRSRTLPVLMLIERGYSVFFPNPRGSSGRGQAFARHVIRDLGGADATDLLAGLDYLVARGFADPKRIGIMGISYGGFMTSWLITQDSRFAAAVSVAPITNHVTAHLISNQAQFFALFLDDRYNNPRGRYFNRSPVMHAHKARTPTLNISGALDRCTPPEEAAQFHSALLAGGVRSVLITYPEEGHGVRKFPAAIDYAARVVSWFTTHMPPTQRIG
jgi:dipeptidyl aminopeptidase/acylaminoacyl peptidase